MNAVTIIVIIKRLSGQNISTPTDTCPKSNLLDLFQENSVYNERHLPDMNYEMYVILLISEFNSGQPDGS